MFPSGLLGQELNTRFLEQQGVINQLLLQNLNNRILTLTDSLIRSSHSSGLSFPPNPLIRPVANYFNPFSGPKALQTIYPRPQGSSLVGNNFNPMPVQNQINISHGTYYLQEANRQTAENKTVKSLAGKGYKVFTLEDVKDLETQIQKTTNWKQVAINMVALGYKNKMPATWRKLWVEYCQTGRMKRIAYSQQDIKDVKKYVELYGHDWEKIASVMGHKNYSWVKNCFYYEEPKEKPKEKPINFLTLETKQPGQFTFFNDPVPPEQLLLLEEQKGNIIPNKSDKRL